MERNAMSQKHPASVENLGQFDPRRQATFKILNPSLPAAWEYIYQNRRLLLRVDQHGPVYAQAEPPSDILLFRREAFQAFSSWLVWIRLPGREPDGFTNFWRPAVGPADPRRAPERFEVCYTPAAAIYTVVHRGIRCVTELFVPPDQAALCLRVALTNTGRHTVALSAFPVLRPYANPAQLAPWDRPEWYLKTALCREGAIGFCTRLANMNSEFDKRRTVVLWSSSANAVRAENSYEKFAGQGSFESPESVYRARLRLDLAATEPWGMFTDANTVCGYPPIYALQYEYTLQPGDTRGFRQVLAMLAPHPRGELPPASAARRMTHYLRPAVCRAARRQVAARYARLMAQRRIATPDAALNRYVNEWLPLQLDWVCSLDRGWPSGMRGSRDSANDFTAMAPLDAAWSRQILETEFSCQRRDGWFPRQYSALGRKGRHDLRGHVDGGVWVIELLHEYLCWTRDLAFLDRRLPWLDTDKPSSVLEHAVAALDFFIRKEHLGEHGLCKLGEGDWLDSVNRAGLRGRGESVTVTAQAIIALTQLTEILAALESADRIKRRFSRPLTATYTRMIAAFKKALRKHAFNRAGFFNGYFNDSGRWLFSDRDPDGRRRIYGSANWFAIASGAADRAMTASVLARLDELQCADGYRMFWPPLGDIPMRDVGRVGTGDQAAGLWENGNVYNQGSQGFLGRALAVAGEGNRLYDVLQWILPYDQRRHPTETALTPPYAVVNCWQGVPLFQRRGGLTFLTGSIAYALRIVYSWLLGIRPTLSGLAVDPCLPAAFPVVTAEFPYRGHRVRLEIRNPAGRQCGVRQMTVNGAPVRASIRDPFSGRTVPLAADKIFDQAVNRVVVTMNW